MLSHAAAAAAAAGAAAALGQEIYQIFTIPLISLPLPLPAEIYKVVNTTVLPVNLKHWVLHL